MIWFYAIDAQQAGPISDVELDELFRSGKINLDTLVWREGMTDWQQLGTARPTAPPTIPAGQSGVICAECGRSFPSADVVMLNRTWVCANCKPIALQRLREGAGPINRNGPWRFNKQLVTSSEASLPDRCVRCNAPAEGFRLKRQLNWHPPGYYFLILLNLLIYAIVAVFVRKRATIHVGLCGKHRQLRKQGIIVCCIGIFGGIGLMIAGGSFANGWIILIGVLTLLGGAIYGAATGAKISAAKITKDNVWIKGVNNDFLAELPEWTEP